MSARFLKLTGFVAAPPASAFLYEQSQTPLPLPVSYSAAALHTHFLLQPYTVLRRVSQIVSHVPSLLLSPSPALLTSSLLELGPAFIKLGQQLSIRPDLLPETYLSSLAALHDNCPTFSDDIAKEIIATELNVPSLDGIFEQPLERVAAASLGQVYKGTLRSSGEEVAVKVQRPNILHTVALDLFIVHELARAWDSLIAPVVRCTL
jgi:predicted unusual protein kinase regulating ubiquinone biosynthesis (AarF/ABC1/UbiB family)